MALPDNWSEYLLEHPLPVRRAIHQGIRRELQTESPDFPRLVGWLRRDPAASSMVLGAAARGQRERQRSAPHNLEHALSLLGSNWVRRHLPEMPVLEDTLTDPTQRAGYLAASSRAFRAARLTETWLIERRETSVEMVAIAALLHNLIELALWRDEPSLARRALSESRRQLIDFTAAHGDDNNLEQCFSLGHAFQAVLADVGIDLAELEHAMTERYYLPVMLLAEEASIPVLGSHHQAILVLARRLAFASEFGWHHPVVRRLTVMLGEQLHLSPDAAWHLTVNKSIRDAREFADIPMYHPAHMLVQHDDGRDRLWPLPADYGLDVADNDYHAAKRSPKPRSSSRQLGDMIRRLATLAGMKEIALYSNVSETQARRRFHWQGQNEAGSLPETIDLQASPLLPRLQTRLEPLTIDADNVDRLEGYLGKALAEAGRTNLIIAPLAVDGQLVSTLCCRGDSTLPRASVLETIQSGHSTTSG
ncbi:MULTISPECIES: hypothetical protein [unclassified Guyparkeria]|uniref:hypothetical protein n=1 Tax=unclassified Guyparkeria TaxID=2626246 RepID=UPI0007336BB5|nr:MULTISPECIES: hypothetical protein [unclassified Guyparkeria]KTG17837.1 hypothetical protein AUR63_06890 [Guyparkeria sp. XI15]OAE89548.1 hypothetical protein AWR35_06900 [Guyparkeria sp. WRN-7]